MDHGIIFLNGEINENSVNTVIEKIIEVNLSQKHDFIQLMLSSGGGDVNAGMALIDIMQYSQTRGVDIYVTGYGLIASMGLCILMAGSEGHRVVTPRTTIMSHRFSKMSMGNYPGLVAQRKVEDLLNQRIMDHYVACSNLSQKDVESKVLRDVDTWLTPVEALGFGFIDQIDGKIKKKKAA